jgi:hypothetical protein
MSSLSAFTIYSSCRQQRNSAHQIVQRIQFGQFGGNSSRNNTGAASEPIWKAFERTGPHAQFFNQLAAVAARFEPEILEKIWDASGLTGEENVSFANGYQPFSPLKSSGRAYVKVLLQDVGQQPITHAVHAPAQFPHSESIKAQMGNYSIEVKPSCLSGYQEFANTNDFDVSIGPAGRDLFSRDSVRLTLQRGTLSFQLGSGMHKVFETDHPLLVRLTQQFVDRIKAAAGVGQTSHHADYSDTFHTSGSDSGRTQNATSAQDSEKSPDYIDWYSLLQNVKPGRSKEEQVYRTLSLRWHPDKAQDDGDKQRKEKFIKILNWKDIRRPGAEVRESLSKMRMLVEAWNRGDMEPPEASNL